MKKILFLLITLLFVTTVYALDCQYTELEKYSEDVELFYLNGTLIGENLDIKEAIKVLVEERAIKIENKLLIPLSFEVNYNIQSGWYGIDEYRVVRRDVSAGNFLIIEDDKCKDRCSFGLVNYSFVGQDLITSSKEKISKERPICKLCNGKKCLDDGESCLSDDVCGSNICNIIGVCGNRRVVKCPDNKMNCNNKVCLLPSTKDYNERYNCEWECKSGVGRGNICKKNLNEKCSFDSECGSNICNIAGLCGNDKVADCPSGYLNCNNKTCLKPSTRNLGEAYNCAWECIRGYGDSGVCKVDPKITRDRKLAFVVVVLIVVAFLVLRFINVGKAKREAEKQAKLIIEKAQSDLEKLNHTIEDKKDQISELTNKKSKSEEIRKKLTESNREIDKLLEEQRSKRNKLKEEREKLAKDRLVPFLNKQGYKVYINENGYEVFERTGTLFHRWWFEHNHNKRIKLGYEIHHKDFNKRNNNIDNLEELTFQEHMEKHRDKYLK